MSNNDGFTKEIYLFLNAVIIVLCIIFSGVNLALSIVLGIICFVMHAFSIAHRADSNFYKVLFSVFSPFFFTTMYLWIIYLFRNSDNLILKAQGTYKYFLALCALLDILYCTLFKEQTKTNKSEKNSNDSQIHEFLNKENNCTSILYEHSPIIISGEIDVFFEEAGKFVIEKNKASVGMLQRLFKIGCNRAERIMDQLCDAGVVGQQEGTKPRRVLMSADEFEYLFENGLILSKGESSDTGMNDSSRIELYNGNFDYMNGIDFECYCADLLRKNGFNSVTVTPSSGDYGADIIAEQNGVRYAIQCKCYSSDIGVDAVYQVSGGMKYYKANVGVVLTNRYFTKQAMELANNIGIILWDRDFLLKLIEKSNSQTANYQTVPENE